MIKRLQSKIRIKGRVGYHANRSEAVTGIIFALLAIFGLFSVLPLIMTVSQSLKPTSELFLYPPKILVQNPTFSNFKVLFDLMNNSWVPISRYLFNTVFISVAGTVLNIIICSLAAYPLAKSKAPFMGFIFGMVTMALMFTPVVNDVVNYSTMSGLNWVDQYSSIIVPAGATSLGLFLMRQFMIQIPDELIKAARIDGAGEYMTLFRIVMPNVRPAWLTLGIFSFQVLWNTGNTPYIYREELKTLPYALSQIVAGGITRIGAGAAVGVVIMIVPIAFFIFSQSQIMETMTTSGIKE
ncbi:MAG: carbohydrate ABC transporter permease [Saccharofermentanales bacterium]